MDVYTGQAVYTVRGRSPSVHDVSGIRTVLITYKCRNVYMRNHALTLRSNNFQSVSRVICLCRGLVGFSPYFVCKNVGRTTVTVAGLATSHLIDS